MNMGGGPLQTCYICGKQKTTSDMNAVSRGEETRWRCDARKDPRCVEAETRRFDWYAGWRRSQGLEPHDDRPCFNPIGYRTNAHGRIELLFEIDGDLLGAVGEGEDGTEYVRFVKRGEHVDITTR